METIVKCPLCDGTAELLEGESKVSYKETLYTLKTLYYKCGECKEEFQTDVQVSLSLCQIPNSIWSKAWQGCMLAGRDCCGEPKDCVYRT